jgi:hypothetical protein
MLFNTKKDILDRAEFVKANPSKSRINQADMLVRIANAMDNDMEVQCNDRWNVGELMDCLVNTIKSGQNSRYAKCNSNDFEDGLGAWELKVSLNCYSLCSVLKEPTRTVLVTSKGAYKISRKALQEVFDNPYDFQDYVKMEADGLKLKEAIVELGKPYKWLNELLGF